MNRPNDDLDDRDPLEQDERRGFFSKVAAVFVGGLVTLFPFMAGVRVLLNPLRRQAGEDKKFFPITNINSLPDDGVPRSFPVIADRKDAWTLTPDERIGGIYLRRMPGESTVQAFNAICPHAGCFVGYDATDCLYRCPCHSSAFDLDGAIVPPSPSPRAMDELETQIEDDGRVLVAFVNYYPGKHERVAK